MLDLVVSCDISFGLLFAWLQFSELGHSDVNVKRDAQLSRHSRQPGRASFQEQT